MNKPFDIATYWAEQNKPLEVEPKPRRLSEDEIRMRAAVRLAQWRSECPTAEDLAEAMGSEDALRGTGRRWAGVGPTGYPPVSHEQFESMRKCADDWKTRAQELESEIGVVTHYAPDTLKVTSCGEHAQHGSDSWEDVTCVECLHVRCAGLEHRQRYPVHYAPDNALTLCRLFQGGDAGVVTADGWPDVTCAACLQAYREEQENELRHLLKEKSRLEAVLAVRIEALEGMRKRVAQLENEVEACTDAADRWSDEANEATLRQARTGSAVVTRVDHERGIIVFDGYGALSLMHPADAAEFTVGARWGFPAPDALSKAYQAGRAHGANFAKQMAMVEELNTGRRWGEKPVAQAATLARMLMAPATGDDGG